MTFLVLLLGLVCYEALRLRSDPQLDRWFAPFASQIDKLFSTVPRFGALAILLLPLLIVAGVLELFRDAFFGLAALVLHVLLLLYALGRDDLRKVQQEFCARMSEGDAQAAYHIANEKLCPPSGMQVEDAQQLENQVVAGIFYQWFGQLFLILFWYLVAGPLAALFVRLLILYDAWLSQNEVQPKESLQILHWVEWLPARLLALSFAVAGNFSQAFSLWLSNAGHANQTSTQLLKETGLAALGLGNDDIKTSSSEVGQILAAIESLLVRSLWVWVALVAIVVVSKAS